MSDPDIYEKCLLSSITTERQDHDLEIIPIINKNNHYSASLAFNLGIDAARSDLLIFAHQDVKLQPGWFNCLDKLLAIIPNDWALLGSAGINLDYGKNDVGRWGGSVHDYTVAVGSVWDRDEAPEPYWDGTKDLTKVHCLDECLFVFKKSVGLRFDTTFTGFHFYGIDLCLQARATGYGVYSAHLPIIHYGKYSASFVKDQRYWTRLRHLYNKWRWRFPELYGTHLHWFLERQATPTGPHYVPEITSYISIDLRANNQRSIAIKAMGIKRVKLKSDRDFGLIAD